MQDADIGDASADVIMFQALHNVSDNMYVYAEGYLSKPTARPSMTILMALPPAAMSKPSQQFGAVYYF